MNGPDRFGWVSRVLHWVMAALILWQLGLGLYMAQVAQGMAAVPLYGLHKSLGLVALALALLRLGWHRLSPPPPPQGDPAALPQRLARAVYHLLYLLMLALPLAGWIGASASGITTIAFNRWTVPPIAPVSAGIEDAAWLAHAGLAAVLAGLLALHVAGAVLRSLKGERGLSRMLGG